MEKHLYQIGKFIIACLLLAGCSSKEIFYFSKNTGSFSPYQKTQKVVINPNNAAILSKTSEPEPTIEDSPVITASTSQLVQAPLLKQKEVNSFNAGLSTQQRETHPVKQAVKNRVQQNFKSRKHFNESEPKKQVQKAALIGFILGFTAIVILLAGSLVGFAFGLAGLIFGIIGLNIIKKKPEKFWGRGLAWFGIAVGIFIPLFIIGYLLAFAGAFGG
ncbi:MAG: DUF4190 domain-containing protein [Bacteroidota bacterium]|nr:DUF4190 domain-containing protein [Bacteroidota bacterium]